ncbi:MAG: SDR family oxidoreductase [Spongiibacteraceae bacterium]|nr:SDR family oxidoreductase [Spongiibacteraceae bacterium]
MGHKMKGRVALITGAGQGIGLAIAQSFAEQGAEVIAADLNADALESAAAIDGVTALLLDVTDSQSVERIGEQYPQIDTLVNCAGFVPNGSIMACSPEDFERSYQINILSMFALIKQVLPNMLARQQGNIINLASTVSTVKAAPSRFAYAVFKGAVIALTKSIAMDFIRQGIRCNAISPGTIDSPSLQQRLRDTGDYDKARSTFISRQPMGRLGLPEEVAATALFLASKDVGFLTGENIIIDGGFTL